jgi:hypothetical protein
MLAFTASLSLVNSGECSLVTSSSEKVDQIEQADANETKVTVHSTAGQLKAGNEQFLAVMGNYGQDSNTVAFSKGEAAAVEALANGKTVAEARAAANESIADYYTVKQRNLIDRWNVGVQTVWTAVNKSHVTDGVSDDFVTAANGSDLNGAPGGWGSNGEHYYNVTGTSTTSVTLLNGSATIVDELSVKGTATDYGSAGPTSTWFAEQPDAVAPGHWFVQNDAGTNRGSGDRIAVRPTSEMPSKTMLHYGEFYNTWTDIEQRSASKKAEMAKYVSQSLGPAMDSGELNATSYVSPATLAQEYANENRSYVQAVATASSMGYDVPDLDNTNSMTISHNGSSYTGFLMSQNAPSGGWEQDQTYEPSLLGGAEFFASVDNGTFRLDGPFTITSIENTEGQQIERVHTQNITYEVSDASANYSALQQEVRTLQSQIEKKESVAGGGPAGPGSGMDVPPWALGGAAVLVVAGLLAVVAGKN